jgi:hypothetical protein
MDTASEAWRLAPPGDSVIGWKLDRAEREQLLARFPPRYARPIADHVTLRSRVAESAELPPAALATLLGRSDDGHGVEAMVVQIEGGTGRPDGGTYHITWSLAEGREAVDSNALIRQHGWEPMEPVALQLLPARFPRS